MKKFKAAIFDMDGTLLDTMYIWRHLSLEYLKQHSIPFPEEMIRSMQILGINNAADFLINTFDIALSHEEMLQELINILAGYYRYQADFKPGAVNFLQKLNDRNIPTMVFSATPEHLLSLALKRLDAEKYFSHGLLSCDTVKSSKHHPEAFFSAAEHFGYAPDDIMIFEDAWYAASTAKKAGFTLGIIADREEKRTAEMRLLADFYVEKSWDEFPLDRFF